MKVMDLLQKMHAGLYPHTLVHNSQRITDLKLSKDPRLPGLSRQLAQAAGKPGPSTDFLSRVALSLPFQLTTSLPQGAPPLWEVSWGHYPSTTPDDPLKGEVTYIESYHQSVHKLRLEHGIWSFRAVFSPLGRMRLTAGSRHI